MQVLNAMLFIFAGVELTLSANNFYERDYLRGVNWLLQAGVSIVIACV